MTPRAHCPAAGLQIMIQKAESEHHKDLGCIVGNEKKIMKHPMLPINKGQLFQQSCETHDLLAQDTCFEQMTELGSRKIFVNTNTMVKHLSKITLPPFS